MTVKPSRANAMVSRRMRRLELQRVLARRRAEAARLAAIARQRAIDNASRAEVQTFINRDITAGEDMEVRRIAVDALGDHAGTVVVLDPNTGRVYTIVNQEWALRRGFKPCSTIKLVTGLAGLGENVIDPNNTTNISDSNRINLTDALAYSNNTYFQQVGGQVGFERMLSYARRLGLGEKTGINTSSEFEGELPSSRTGYAVNHMSSHGDDFKVTPMQLAILVSAMANGGNLLAPRVLRSAQEMAVFKPRIRRSIGMDLNLLRYMVPGMVGAVNYGSGRRAYDPQSTVAGKTGTCIDNGSWVGLFTSYAPLAHPRLAVVVIARGADGRSHFPAAVAGRIYRELNGRFGTPTNLQMAETRQTDDKKLSSLDEEDGEERQDDHEANEDAGKNVRPTSSSADRLETSIDANRKLVPQPLMRPATNTNSSVHQVLMPIAKKSKGRTTSQTHSAGQLETRPRRVYRGRQ